jgi:nicotinate-nucleotide adenylyltransferase
LGATFNPIHLGHLILAQSALETFDLAKVLFIPCRKPPHKDDTALISAAHRFAMVEAALEGDFRFEPCDVEIRRGGVSYAIDTLRDLQPRYRDAELHFIIGADALPELHLWKNIYSLLPLCRFVVFSRAGVDLAALTPDDLHLDPPWPERLLQNITVGPRVDISSTNIRYRIAEGMRIRYLVPAAVEMYIAEHGLYRSVDPC